jgi:hypothetical protein
MGYVSLLGLHKRGHSIDLAKTTGMGMPLLAGIRLARASFKNRYIPVILTVDNSTLSRSGLK